MYFKSLKVKLMSDDNKKGDVARMARDAFKRLRQRNSVFFSMETIGRHNEINRVYLGA